MPLLAPWELLGRLLGGLLCQLPGEMLGGLFGELGGADAGET